MAMLACLPAYLLARSEMLWPAGTGGSESGSLQILCRIAPAWEAGRGCGGNKCRIWRLSSAGIIA